jgi:hypothetical protein
MDWKLRGFLSFILIFLEENELNKCKLCGANISEHCQDQEYCWKCLKDNRDFETRNKQTTIPEMLESMRNNLNFKGRYKKW